MPTAKPADLRPLRPRARRIPPLAALLFVVCVLLVFNLSYWQLFKYLRNSKETDLRRRLENVAGTSVQALKNPTPPSILSQIAGLPVEEQSQQLGDFADMSSYDELLRRVTGLQVKGGLSQLTLITAEALVVADGTQQSGPGDPYVYTIDAAYIRQALDLGMATTPLYSPYKDGALFQRTYQRMTDDSGKVLGLLQASISPDYIEELTNLRGRVLRLWLASTVMLIGIGISLYRVFKYLVRLERSALQGARVEAMGALAGGVAHELRNPLAIIRALAEEIESEQAKESRCAQNARDIVNETQRLGDLVSHFLSLSHAPKKGEGSAIDLKLEIERVLQLLRKGAPESVRFEADLAPGAVLVHADERALRQLFLNLLINARESLRPEGGEVKVSLRTRRNDAEIVIADNGAGINQRDAARLFEPFFTTKPAGTGLGLAISRSIVENLGGEIQVQSKEGQGTQVLITVPTVSGPGN